MLSLLAKRTVVMSGAALPMLPTGEPALLLRSLSGTEKLSHLYEYVLECRTPLQSVMPAEAAANLDLTSMIGKELTVTIQLEGMGTFLPGMPGMSAVNVGSGTREISGIVTEAHLRTCSSMIDSSVAPSGIAPRLITSPEPIAGKRIAFTVVSINSSAGSVRAISLVW
ncbi:Rhs element Vgr protein [Caballeronia temeraria]|uniref:Rhs element Vgr protein n=1 Tax=Caballeronia temeraria TaxID=1777137 RepID=A0A158A7Z9_9BURK|nr:contractile injection system protein, VgrG/Pvc8 family [Caballeronia temeraria]SAK53217.1 Rhs element Vgr protein [Caballeronia temeraria]